MRPRPTHFKHSDTRWVVIALAFLGVGLCGCPNSPLLDLIEEQLASSADDGGSQSSQSSLALPQPVVLFAGMSGDLVRIEFAVDESDPSVDNVLGYNVYRSEQSGAGYVIQRAFARFEELVFFDTAARIGITYYYVIKSVDRLGNESEPSQEVAIDVPVGENQIVVHADEIVGTVCTKAMGVADLNIGEMNFDADEPRATIRDLGTHWWRVSMARWDAGRMLTEQEIIDREVFFGTTMADAQNPALYRWTHLDRVIANALASGATPIISIDTMPRSLAQNRVIGFREPLCSWSDNVRNSPPTSSEVFAEVVKRIIMHYTTGWGGGSQFNLPYWELWHAPDIDETFGLAAGLYWTGTQQQFHDMYAACHRAVKAQFGDTIRFGGAAFADPTSVEPFLQEMDIRSITPDFVSFIANNDLPIEIVSITQTVLDALDAQGLSDIETFLAGFNMALPLPGLSDPAALLLPNPKFDTTLHAIHYLSVFKSMCDLGVDVVLHEGLRDLGAGTTGDLNAGLNSGLVTFDHETKPVSVAIEALQLLDANNNRLRIEPTTAVALAGINNDNNENEIVIILVNPEAQATTFTLDVRNMPWGSLDSFDWSLEVLSDETFTGNEGFGGQFGGTVTGQHLTIAPALPAFSILKLTITGPP